MMKSHREAKVIENDVNLITNFKHRKHALDSSNYYTFQMSFVTLEGH